MRAATLRRLRLNIHLWIGVGLAVLLIPISISGGLMVWHDEIDTLINPQRYAVTGAQVARVHLSRVDSNETVTVTVDDRSGRAAPTIIPQSGDRAASWIRWIHEGSHKAP